MLSRASSFGLSSCQKLAKEFLRQVVGVSIVEGDLICSPDCWNAYLTVLLRHLAPNKVYKVPKKMQ